MDIRFAAKTYIDRGWQVVPLNAGEKKASVRWQSTVYKPSDFNDDSNVAIKMGDKSGGLVDVDCDHPFTVAAAKLLLPDTGCIFGRASKPDSHYLFVSPGLKTTQFTDIKDANGNIKMLVEIRSTNGYTMLPPSIHPSGESVTWTLERDPQSIDNDALYNSVRAVALAALIAEHWGALDHASMGHLAGFWLQGKLDPMLVVQIFKTIGRLVPGNFGDEIVKFARRTIDKFNSGEQVTGGPKLIEYLGADVVAKMRSWLRMADMDALEEMNARHFFVTLGTKSVIGREDKPEGVVFQPVRELYPEYANRQVQTGTDKDGNAQFGNLFETWLKAPSRRSFSRVVFAPPPLTSSEETEYNLWKGFAIEPAEGDCSKFRAHLRDIVCSGNDEHFDYLEKFCAFTVQQPGIPAGCAVVMRGRQGTGKGTVLQMFRRIFGKHHFTQLSRSEELVKWNALVSGKVVVFADEAFFAGDKENIGALKRIITEPTITIARKHLDSTEEANCIHLFMATNEEWAIPAGLGERRFFAVEVSDAKEQDEKYFGAIYDEMAAGGDAAFLHHLLGLRVTHADLRAMPKTAELRHQQNQSLPLHLKWMQECLYDGMIGQVTWSPVWVPVVRIYDSYKMWVREHTNRFLDKLEFGRQASHFLTGSEPKAKRINGESTRCIELRPLDEARRIFDERLKTQSEWPGLRGASVNPSIPF